MKTKINSNNWVLPDTNASNASGFTAIRSGKRGSEEGIFNGQGIYKGWWSATELDISPLNEAWCRWIHGDTTVVARNEIFKKEGFSFRRIKD